MKMNWTDTYHAWREAVDSRELQEAHQILTDARKRISQQEKEDRWSWFIDALDKEDNISGFAVNVIHKHSIPKTLLSPILEAAMKFGNPTSIKFYVLPCVETYGKQIVEEYLEKLAREYPDGDEKLSFARYWLHRTNSTRTK